MPAVTKWWFCGACGFQNRPRMAQDNTKCEQCGHSQDPTGVTDPVKLEQIDNDVDFVPGDTARA